MRPLAASIAVALLGCGPPGRSGYALLDADARIAGWSFELGRWSGAPATPVRVESGDRLWLVQGEERQSLAVEADRLTWVTGRAGTAKNLSLDSDVRPDALTVEGEFTETARLAQKAEAKLDVLGAGMHRLSRNDLYEHASFLETSAAVINIAPVGVLDETVVAAVPPRGAEAPAPIGARLSLAGNGDEDDPRLDLVGLHLVSGGALIIDATGHYALERGCGAEPATGAIELHETHLLLRPSSEAPRVLDLNELTQNALR